MAAVFNAGIVSQNSLETSISLTSNIYNIGKLSCTYDHRLKKTQHPVRSAMKSSRSAREYSGG